MKLNLATLHLVSTYLLLSLGTTGLWLGEAEAAHPYPAIVCICAVVAFVFTDRLRVMQLPHLVSNFLGLIVLGAVSIEWLSDKTSFVICLAHFLVYLQVVKFFREKLTSDFWLLYALNVLQLAIACVINRNISFGLLLIAYMCMAVVSLTLLHLRRHQNLLMIANSRGDQRPTPCPPPRLRWPLTAQFIAVCVLSLPLALLLFWIVPRSGQAANFSSSLAVEQMQLVTGFSDNVRLDELGNVMESNAVVFNVWAKDRAGKAATLSGDILWRGKVFTHYDRKQWQASPRGFNRAVRMMERYQGLTEDQIELIVEQETRTGETCFFPKPLYAAALVNEAGGIHYVRMESRLVLADANKGEPPSSEKLRYRLITHRSLSAYRDPDEIPPSRSYLERTLQLPGHLVEVRRLAEQLTEGLSDNDVQGKIRRVMDYLTTQDRFGYSLDLRPVDTELDPVEDFLKNRKEGHCEYFASAAALILRAAGVSTRVINGFKGADYNQAGGYYQIRQLLAHAWAEAYVPEGAYWMTIDPTPVAARAQSVELQRSRFQPLTELADAGKRVWSDYIIGYNDSNQRTLRAIVTGVVFRLAAWVRNGVRELGAAAVDGFRQLATLTFWLSWRGLVTVIALGLFGWGLHALQRWLRGLWARRRHRRQMSPGGELAVYARWLSLLKRHGLVRRPGQTPREFALLLQGSWNDRPETRRWSALPLELVDCFYAVRFGTRVPDERQLQQLQQRVEGFAREGVRSVCRQA